MHHAYVVEGETEVGVGRALEWIASELGMSTQGNADVIVFRYSLFSVAHARRVFDLANQAPVSGENKALVIAASRIYQEAQNALLKLFEEPPAGTYLILVLPTLGGLLPTLRSRVQTLDVDASRQEKLEVPEIATEFIRATPERRSAVIKRLASGRDEDERRDNRDRAIELANGIERAAYSATRRDRRLLSDIQTLRAFLHERSAPVKMILEHLAIVTPRDLV